MRYLDAAATRAALPMPLAISAMEVAFSDDAEAPVRSLLGGSLFMPGRAGPTTGVKAVSVVPGMPVGIVAVFASDGSLMGLVDGPELTKIRTGAASGLASRLLAPADASVLAMLGAGAMAADQIAAVRTVREVERVVIWSRNRDRAEELAVRVGGSAVASPGEALAEADIVCCATPATEPLFGDEQVRSTTHINAVGAFRPEMVEVPPATLRRSFVVVDDRLAAAEEAGDLLQAGRDPDATVADLLSGRAVRPSGTPSVFKSVGIAPQDVAAGALALERAQALGLGTEFG